MPFTHHSHSGQFCSHAKDGLEEVVQTAISKGMRVLALTEHAPRDQPEDLYPEEVAKKATNFELFRTFADYHTEAVRLRAIYGENIHILIGFELDYIRESSIGLVKKLQDDYPFDMFIGSVHHVYTVPIDFDAGMYRQAKDLAGGTEELLFEAYFEAQYEMLSQLNPPVIGHFDLIRLFSSNHHRGLQQWEGVWDRIVKNVEYVISYGGLFELNSASLRKGMPTPYPQRDICELIIAKGGRFTFSDDSHGVAQVGLNYHRLLSYAESLGLEYVYYLERLPMGQMAVDCLGPCKVRHISMNELKNDDFFARMAMEMNMQTVVSDPEKQDMMEEF